MTLESLSPGDLISWMQAYEQALARHRAVVNRLNVYPVPDGDTGTNMHLTLESVNRELSTATEAGDMASVCKAISHGSLMGARGNSGVILCQVLRGMASVFQECDGVSAGDLARALEEANSAARAGVMRPVEGTILTVAGAAAKAATESVLRGEPVALLGVALSARKAAVTTLERTPELLSVLAAAGVVDAGGAGLLLMFDALLSVIDGRPLPDSIALPEHVAALLRSGRGPDLSSHAEGERSSESATTGSLRFEVMYFLEAGDEAIGAFREVWAGIGDSIVVVGGEGLWNCHIHTDDIGAAIEAGIDCGRPRQIRVTDLSEQVEEESWVRSAEHAAAGLDRGGEQTGPTPVTSVVAVATGGGIGRIFRSLGVRQLVAGGQSMNPSTAQILDAIDTAPGREVVVLPNNKNIYAVAAQASEISSKPARVVDTSGIQEGFAALLEYDPEASAEDNFHSMSRAAARVVAGEVTRAVRPSGSSAGPIAVGDWIGLSREGIVAVAHSPAEAATSLLAKLVTDDHEIVTLIEGSGASAAETRRITEWLASNCPRVTVELHHGGQPLYPYLVSAE